MRKIVFLALTFFRILYAQDFNVTFSFLNVAPGTGRQDPGPFPAVAGLTFMGMNAIGVSEQPSASGRFAFTGWSTGAINGNDDYSQFTGSLSPFKFYEFKLKVAPTHTMELEEISFHVRRSSTGIRHYCVRSHLDQYTANLAASTGNNTRLAVVEDDVFFWKFDSVSTSSDLRGSMVVLPVSQRLISDSLVLRIFAWNAESATGSFSIDNFNLKGKMVVENGLVIDNRTVTDQKPFLLSGRQLSFHQEVIEMQLSDLSGHMIILKPQVHQVYDLSEIPAGVYILRCKTSSEKFVKKLVLY